MSAAPPRGSGEAAAAAHLEIRALAIRYGRSAPSTTCPSRYAITRSSRSSARTARGSRRRSTPSRGWCGRTPARSASRERGSTAGAPGSSWRAASVSRPRAARCSRASPSRRTWRSAPTRAADRRAVADGPRARLRALPGAPGAAPAAGRHALRGRAADAHHRPRAHGAPAAAPAGRARRWARAPDRPADLPDHAEIRRQGVTSLLVEQNVHLAFTVADRATSWRPGGCAFRARPASSRDEAVIRTYLGG